MKRYTPNEIEPKWQEIWADTGIYEVSEDSKRQKIYATPMLPYPSGSGLHVGHVRNYSIADAVARFYRQRGYNVMSNIGWDAFGLPAENYAIKTGTPPWETTEANIKNFKKQLKRIGISYAWDREINTSDPSYYKWTQWIFTKLMEHGLAYQAESLQWWCPECKTVLANEQVVNGCCWRHETTPVEKKLLTQWFFKITDYAERLLEGLDSLDWPQHIVTQQRNWIGKSQGAEIEFVVDGHQDLKLKVFTTRPDTIFGATFMVLAPEHPLIEKITSAEQKGDVNSYVSQALKKSDVDRQDENKQKTGVFSGSYAVNPANKQKIPIWIGDFVLGGYGTGAIMAVPGHDSRDREFARKYSLPIIRVIEPITGEAQKNPVTKHKIVAVVENDQGKILTNLWKPELGGRLLIGGGIDEGENPAQAAIREVKEETGYQDVELVAVSEETVFHEYFAFSKKTPTRAITKLVHLKLTSDNQTDTAREDSEKGNFIVEWLDKDLAYREITDEQHLRALDLFVFDRTYEGEGVLVNSGKYDGMESPLAREKIVADLEKRGLASATTQYRIRDWLISRQRYWGAPIPVIHCPDCGAVPVPEADLPVELPKVKNFAPTGETTSVLAAVEDWVNVPCPKCKKPAKRETDTMDGYACSSWYMHRYTDARNDQAAWDRKNVDYWFPVDFYFGGDHAVSHLLYFRFWNYFFADIGLINPEYEEPVKKLVFNGYINAAGGGKMSKSKGNVVDPLDVIESGYGADALRMFELFIGPYNQDVEWNPAGVPGTYRFLQRVWTLVNEFMDESDKSARPDSEKELLLASATHKTIRKVTGDLEDLRFNTAIAATMELVNTLNKLKTELPFGAAPEAWRTALSQLIQLLAPFAPYITEELWRELGHEESVHTSTWPSWDKELVKDDLITIVVQVNGKLRANLSVPADSSEDEIVALAKNDETVKKYLAQSELVRTVYVPGKLVNFVVK